MKRTRYLKVVLVGLICSLLLGACYRTVPNYKVWVADQPISTNGKGSLPKEAAAETITAVAEKQDVQKTPVFSVQDTPTITPTFFATMAPPTPIPPVTLTLPPPGPQATPNSPIEMPALRSEPYTYTWQEGDKIEKVAFNNQVSITQIQQANPYTNLDGMLPELKLVIPPATENEEAPVFKIIPDSEVFYGPIVKDFNTAGMIKHFNGFLTEYSETQPDVGKMNAYEIVQRVADENSVNPRLLLALIEYRSGWLTQNYNESKRTDYPLGYRNPKKNGLYNQLSWAAAMLMAGSTAMRSHVLSVWALPDSTVFRVNPTINSGTAAIQYLFSAMMNKDEWVEAVSENGFYKTYLELFGYPFAFDTGELIPDGLTQPALTLPFPKDTSWYLSSGPHYGWGVGSPWAALDFIPPDVDFCNVGLIPVVAVADGDIVRSSYSQVVIDLDGDKNERTGWTILYMHIAADKKIPNGVHVKAGDVIGYASCEGGFTSGTHVHVARKYNGVWINAGGEIPFVMSGWTAFTSGSVYNGGMSYGDYSAEAFGGKSPYNLIWRDE
ncbi:MAG: M23 family metallopeptidase [Anaerolineaceae bacterium]|nr:M23 family metallopeptidase [Anaerolineaceae bacterium]